MSGAQQVMVVDISIKFLDFGSNSFGDISNTRKVGQADRRMEGRTRANLYAPLSHILMWGHENKPVTPFSSRNGCVLYEGTRGIIMFNQARTLTAPKPSITL